VWHTPALRAPLLALIVIGTLAFAMQMSVPTLIRGSFGAAASSIGPRAPFVIGAGAALATIVIASTSRRARLGAHRGTERVPTR
jgi:hypothetical protein